MDGGNKLNKKDREDQDRRNKWQKQVRKLQMLRTCRQKGIGRSSNENMEDESEWTVKDTKTKTEVE